MKLIFGGVTYNYNPNRKKIDPTISNLTHITKPCYELIYHGAVYRVTRNGCDRYLTLK